MVTKESVDAPDFNGMSPEVFYAGSRIRDIMDSLGNDHAAELRPRLTQEMINQALSRPATAEQLDDLIDVFQGGSSRLAERRKINSQITEADSRQTVDLDY